MAKSDDPRVDEVRARMAARDKSVEDFYAQQEGLRPTPTQEENDLAKVGAMTPDDPKEDDGSDWEIDHQRKIMEARVPGNNPYDTRAFESGPEGADAPRRGRPRKSETE